tara:strand:+ start:36 stop:167 length:132 start_codon:yes stop_codon:yes gene_type:complete
MIKKLSLALILCSLMVSCGKKGDPSFTEPKAKNQTFIELIKKV